MSVTVRQMHDPEPTLGRVLSFMTCLSVLIHTASFTRSHVGWRVAQLQECEVLDRDTSQHARESLLLSRMDETFSEFHWREPPTVSEPLLLVVFQVPSPLECWVRSGVGTIAAPRMG